LEALNSWVVANGNFLKTLLGVIYPVAVLTILELTSKGENPGWKKLQTFEAEQSEIAEAAAVESNPIAAKVVAVCLAICGAMMFALILANDSSHGILAAFGAILCLISATIFYLTRGNS
jgi:SSS family solute:Na+ symporter